MAVQFPDMTAKLLVRRMGRVFDEFSFQGRPRLFFLSSERFSEILSWMQAVVALHFNRCMRELYIKLMENGRRITFSDLNAAVTPMTAELNAYIRQGLYSKSKASFREAELRQASSSLPFANGNFPVPYGGGFKIGTVNTEGRTELAIAVAVPMKLISEGGDGQAYVPLVMSTASRQRRVEKQARAYGEEWRGKSTDEIVMGLLDGKYGSTYCEVFIRNGKVWASLSVTSKRALCPQCGSDKWKENKKLPTKCAECGSTEKLEAEEKGKKKTVCAGCGSAKFYNAFRCYGMVTVGEGKTAECGYVMYEDALSEMAERGRNLDPGVLGGINFGIRNFAFCATNNSDRSLQIPGHEIIQLNQEWSNAARAFTSKNRFKRGGHGSEYKMRIVSRMSDGMERRRETLLRQTAAQIAGFFAEERASMIYMSSMAGIKESSVPWNFLQMFQIKYVPYGALIASIRHALAKEGIASSLIDESVDEERRVELYDYTSQLCHACGHWNEYFTFEWRQANGFPTFECRNCGLKIDPDFNASKRASMGEEHQEAVMGIMSR